ncbi:MAG: hypothetical protein U1F56_02650 [Rubrivivax sp.]
MTSQSRARPRRRAAARAAAALLLAGAGAHAADYEPGQGLALGTSGVTLGGYLTAEYQHLGGGRSQWRSSHASVFAWWEGFERLKLLGEIDQENALSRRRGPFDDDGGSEERLSLQRLHADWTFDDALVLRGGKFLTPVGRWNVSHAGPLVWTTNRPLLTQSVYPRQVTGLMASGQLAAGSGTLSYAAYASNGLEWDADPRQDLFASVRGLRLLFAPGGGVQLGLSWAAYEQRGSRGEPRTLLGLDALWARHGWELQAEWLHTESTTTPPGPARPPGGGGGVVVGGGGGLGGPAQPRPAPRAEPTRGAYLQGVMPLPAQLSLVARVERLRDTAVAEAFRQRTLGLAWRPNAMLSLKLEHQWSSGRADLGIDGWTTSLSVLF